MSYGYIHSFSLHGVTIDPQLPQQEVADGHADCLGPCGIKAELHQFVNSFHVDIAHFYCDQFHLNVLPVQVISQVILI